MITKRQVLGQMILCKGCCCGRTDRGLPEVPVERIKEIWRREKLNRSIQLSVSGCLGPCDVPNVVLLITPEGKKLHRLRLGKGPSTFGIQIDQAGSYALFTQHHPQEFQAVLHNHAGPLTALFTHEYKPDHEHDDAVTSVGISIPGDLSEKKLNAWLRDLLMNHGPDIFRMKGVLSIKGEDRRFVFQGIHMLFDGRPDRLWGQKEIRHNSLIFIGRNLDRGKLEGGFKACLA
jgi:hypothetical protein